MCEEDVRVGLAVVWCAAFFGMWAFDSSLLAWVVVSPVVVSMVLMPVMLVWELWRYRRRR